MLHEFTVVLFRKINVCIRCAFMTLNSLLDCDLPACSKNCIRWLIFLCGVVIVFKRKSAQLLGEMFVNLEKRVALLWKILLWWIRLFFFICVGRCSPHKINGQLRLECGSWKMVSQGLHISKSSIWLGLRPLLNDIFQYATWTVGNGESIYFWTDRWLAMPIVDIWQIHVHLHKVLTMKVADFVIEGQWQIPDYFLHKDVSLVQQIYGITLPIDSIADTLSCYSL